MCTNVNHNYGVSIDGIPPMLAVPLAGPVKITVKDLDGKVVGETTATPQGEWRDTFCLDDGTYVVEFSGIFRPIGTGFKSIYNKPVTSTTVTIEVPLTGAGTPPTEGVGPSGPPGPPGPQGPQGPQGEQGSAGDKGDQGEKGDKGDQGIQGPAGPQGIQGVRGVKGDQGVQGPQGTQGVQGPQGVQGGQGETGVAGATGPQGPPGADGSGGGGTGVGQTGATGATGPQGPAGTDGQTGATGPEGVDGATGPQGATGPAGPAGADGAVVTSAESYISVSTGSLTEAYNNVAGTPFNSFQDDTYGATGVVSEDIHTQNDITLNTYLGEFTVSTSGTYFLGCDFILEVNGVMLVTFDILVNDYVVSTRDVTVHPSVDPEAWTAQILYDLESGDRVAFHWTPGAGSTIQGWTGTTAIIFKLGAPQGDPGETGAQGATGAIGSTGPAGIGVTGPQGATGPAGADGEAGGTGDHGFLTGLSDDDHAQYALLTGRDGGQVLQGGTGPSDTLTLESTSDLVKGTIKMGVLATDTVTIGNDNTITASHKLEIHGSARNALGSPLADHVDVSELHAIIYNDGNIRGSGSALGLSVSSDANDVGAAIAHENVQSTSIGKLHFATKGATGVGADIPIRMTIDNAGRVGIGTTSPTQALHIANTGVGASILIDGITGVDGIIFPDRTIQTTAAAAGAGSTGATGPAGADGAVGATGATGPAGADGQTGPQGPAGADGTSVTGATGDHGFLQGLADDDHAQYALLAGRSGGQTLIGGAASGEDLTLLPNSDASTGTVFVANANSAQTVAIGSTTTSNFVKLTVAELRDSFPAPTTELVNVQQLTAVFGKDVGTEGAAGIGFAVDSNLGQVGAAIIHERRGTNSLGKLHFATKNTTISEDNIPVRMTLSEVGNLGIGTTGPTQMLHLQGTTGASIFIDGTTGVDGIIFPDRTIQTTAATGGAGSTGATGPQGPAGADGADGQTGVTGATGPQGPAGVDGTSVTGATGDHGFLQGLADDDHAQYALLAGRSGGQSLAGSDAASENLTFTSTSSVTKGNIIIGTSAIDTITVGQNNTTSQSHKFEVHGSTRNPMATNEINISDMQQVIYCNADSNLGAGLGLSVSTDGTDIGAAIVHERTGANSAGKLHFATKPSGYGVGADLPIWMTLDESGRLGIGVTGPTHKLHIAGTGASILIDGETGVDGIIFPDRTIQTTAATGGAGSTGATGPQGPAGADGADGQTGATGATGPQGPAGADGADGVSPTGATGDHGFLTGLSDDDHAQYALLAGRSGGQILYGGSDSGDDLRLLSNPTANGEIFMATANSAEQVVIGAVLPSGASKLTVAELRNSFPNPTSKLVDINQITSVFSCDTGTDGGAGIGFSVGTNVDEIGAAIVHERRGTSSRGKLHFATKLSTASEVDIPVRMTLDESGRLGIGTTGPTQMLHLQGTTGASIFIDGTTGVDGIIFPDRTIQTTAATGGAGSTGATGPQGPAGADGADGQTGVTGATGPQGPAGVDGTSVTGATGDHGFLQGLSDDDHAQYALLAGRSGGQILIGENAIGGVLTLRGNTYVHVDDGKLLAGVDPPSSNPFPYSICGAGSASSIDFPNVDVSSLQLGVGLQSTTIGTAAGIGFSVTDIEGSGGANVGAAIIHERTGSQSQGKLHFATKNSTTAFADIPIWMTLDESGRLGIGVTGPTHKLHIAGIGASILIDGETGVDGIIFPDRTIQTTAATGGEGATGATGPQGPQGPAGADGGGTGATGDHGFLIGLSDDDHTQYALLAGRSGGQVLQGDTASSGSLTLDSTSNSTKGIIYLGTTATSGQSIVRRNANAVTGTNVDISELSLRIHKYQDTNNEATGIGFGCSSTEQVGAAIIHERTSTNSLGKLHFATKDVTTGLANIPIRMTIDNSGYVGIGVMSPAGDLDVHSGTGVIVYSPTTPGDWSVVPDDVFEALDSLASGAAAGGSLGTFNAMHMAGPTTDNAAFATANDHPLLAFIGTGTTVIRADFEALMPQNYAGGNIDVLLHYVATTADTGDIEWSVAFERQNEGFDIDSDSFATAQVGSETPSTGNVVNVITISFTNAQADSIAVGEGYRLRISRDPADAQDTYAQTAYIFKVELVNG